MALEVLGKRRFLTWTSIISTASSLLCYFSWNMASTIILRGADFKTRELKMCVIKVCVKKGFRGIRLLFILNDLINIQAQCAVT